MPFYIRDSVSFGPFRINLSKSGLGFSTGVRGFRVGTGPKGHYIHAGMKGIYYRKTLGGLGRRATSGKSTSDSNLTTELKKLAPHDKLPSYLTEDGVLMRRVLSADAELLVSETHAEALRSLNAARDRTSFRLLLSIAAFAGMVFAMLSGNPVAITGFLVLLVAAYFIGGIVDTPRRNVLFMYSLEPEAEARYKALVDTIDRIATSSGLWYVKARGDITNLQAWKKNSGASSLVDTQTTSVSYALPPGVVSNVTPPMILIDGRSCYFFPDCILVMENRKYGAVRYESLRAAVRDQRMIVDRAPSDAVVVGQTWKYVNKSGGPDRRFRNNRQLPICLYEEIGMISDGGFKGLLQLSRRGAGEAFSLAITDIGRNTMEIRNADPLLIPQVE